MAKLKVGDTAPGLRAAGHRRQDLQALRLPRPQGDPRLLPGRLHRGLHETVLLLPRPGRAARRPRRRRARDLAAIGRVARALHRGEEPERAAARRRGQVGGTRLRRPRRPDGPPGDLRDRRGGRDPPPQGDAGRAHLRVGRRPRAGASPHSADGRPPRRQPSRSAPAPTLRGESGGGGAADRPLPRDHRDPPLRRPRLAGARARRLPRRRLRRPRPRRVRPGPAPERVMDTRSWSATSSGSSRPRWGRAASSSPATRWAPTPPSPTRSRTPSGWPGWS